MSAEVRHQAINPAGSFLVQAPAGSGKTELLTQRILKLLAVVDQPEEILALTFTRKAAAEMRGRVVEALSMAKPDQSAAHKMQTWQLAQEANARSQALGWHLLEHPSRLRMMTLDSFTHALAKQLPLLSGLGDMPTPSTYVAPLYREAAETAVVKLVGINPEQAEAVLLHQDHNMVALIGLLADMLGKRDQWLHEVEVYSGDTAALRIALERSLSDIMEQKFRQCCDLMPSAARLELPGLIAFAAANRGDPVLAALQVWPDESLSELSLWQQITRELMTGNSLRKPGGINVKRGFPPDKEFADRKKRFQYWLEQMVEIEGLEASLSNLQALPSEPRFDEAQWQVLKALLELLKLANKDLQSLFERRGEADFIEIALRALRALEDDAGRPTDLLLKLDYRIHHILVDEFQDTSVLQMRLLQNLTEGWQSGDGVNRSLFMVGDPMQSIYRFRKAEVGLFLLAAANRARLPPVTALKLERNFRSSPVIVDWVNRAFASIFPDEPDILLAAVGHAPAQAALGHDGGVHLHLQQQKNADAEAMAIVETVQAELKKANQRIAVLARSRKHLHTIMHALNDAGVAFRAMDVLPLHRQSEIRLIRALLRALLHPADRESWAALLRGPGCGLTTEALHTLLADDSRAVELILNDEQKLSLLDSGSRSRVLNLKVALMPCLQLSGHMPVRPLLSMAWNRLRMPGLIDPMAANNIDAMLDLVEEIEQGGSISFSLLDERLEKLYSAPDSSEQAARVELLTMHGAKGLQWDVVILPGLGHGGARSDSPLLAFTDIPVQGTMHPLIAVRGAVRSSDAIFDLVSEVEKTRKNNELARLLYVACTRAESSLHMFGHVSESSGEASSGSLLKLLLPDGLASDGFGAEMNILESTAASSSRLRPQLDRIATLHEVIDQEADSPANRLESEYFWAGPEAAPIGNAVHAVLQQVSEKGIEAWNDSDEANAGHLLRRALMADGLAGQTLEDAVKRSQKAIETALASKQGQWILSSEHVDAHSEWALSSVQDGMVIHQIIDRSFIDHKGVRWIIDYKTASHEGGGLNIFLEEESKRHAPQLQRYAAILAQIEPDREIRTALYFPMLDEWKEVDSLFR